MCICAVILKMKVILIHEEMLVEIYKGMGGVPSERYVRECECVYSQTNFYILFCYF